MLCLAEKMDNMTNVLGPGGLKDALDIFKTEIAKYVARGINENGAMENGVLYLLFKDKSEFLVVRNLDQSGKSSMTKTYSDPTGSPLLLEAIIKIAQYNIFEDEEDRKDLLDILVEGTAITVRDLARQAGHEITEEEDAKLVPTIRKGLQSELGINLEESPGGE
jgi:hypothetical protein